MEETHSHIQVYMLRDHSANQTLAALSAVGAIKNSAIYYATPSPFFAFGLSAKLTSKAWNLLFPHPALRARRDFSFKWFLYDTYEDE
jgi:hypothetical protein